MKRAFLVLLVASAIAGCSTTPLVTKQRMTFAEAKFEGMDCKRDKSANSNIVRSVCASKDSWRKFEDSQADKSARMMDDIYERTDTRVLYPR